MFRKTPESARPRHGVRHTLVRNRWIVVGLGAIALSVALYFGVVLRMKPMYLALTEQEKQEYAVLVVEGRTHEFREMGINGWTLTGTSYRVATIGCFLGGTLGIIAICVGMRRRKQIV